MPKKTATATGPEAKETPKETQFEAPTEEAKSAEPQEIKPEQEREDRFKKVEAQLQELDDRLAEQKTQHVQELEQVRREGASETDRRVSQAVQKKDAENEAQRRQERIADLQRRANLGEEGAADQLAQVALEPAEQARRVDAETQIRTESTAYGYVEGRQAYAASLNARAQRAGVSPERMAELIPLFNQGKDNELEAEMAKEETKGAGPSEGRLVELEKRLAELTDTRDEASEEERVAGARTTGPDLGGGAPGAAGSENAVLGSNKATGEEKAAAFERKHGYKPKT